MFLCRDSDGYHERVMYLSTLNTQSRIVDAETGLVESLPRRSRIAITGFGETRTLAPWDDDTWRIWGLNHGYALTQHPDKPMYLDRRGHFRADAWFELHPIRVQPEDDWQWMQICPLPIYVLDLDARIPNAAKYPLARAEALGCGAGFASTFAYQTALAILEGAEEIGYFGLDFVEGRELAVEMPNLARWIGFAEARGIRITIPPESVLLRHRYRYGYDYDEEAGFVSKHVAYLRSLTGAAAG